jgi:hypothetical protein
MAQVHARQRWKRQPAAPLTARGQALRHAWLPSVGGIGAGALGLMNVAQIGAGRGAHGIFGSGGGVAGGYHRLTSHGWAIYLDDSGTGTTASKAVNVGDSAGSGAPGGQRITFHTEIYLASLPGADANIYGSDSNHALALRINTSGGMHGTIPFVGDATAATTNLAAGQWYSIAYTYDGDTFGYFINGLAVGTAAVSATLNHAFQYALGSGNIPNGSMFTSPIVWDRVLNPTEIAALAANPYSIYQPVKRFSVNTVGGGGGGDTNARLIGGDLLQPLGFGRLVC